MKKDLTITATLDQPDLLESLVQRLAGRRYDIGYLREIVPQNWQPVEVSSTETYVSGTLSFSNRSGKSHDLLNIPFITSFLFTCIKVQDDEYRLLWSCSLS